MQTMDALTICLGNIVGVTLNHALLVAYRVLQNGIVGPFALKRDKSIFPLLK